MIKVKRAAVDLVTSDEVDEVHSLVVRLTADQLYHLTQALATGSELSIQLVNVGNGQAGRSAAEEAFATPYENPYRSG